MQLNRHCVRSSYSIRNRWPIMRSLYAALIPNGMLTLILYAKLPCSMI